MQDAQYIIDTTQLQDICDQISGEIDAAVSIVGVEGKIIASSRRSRIGDFHPRAAEVMEGKENYSIVTASDAEKSSTMLEGIMLPVDIGGRRVFGVGIAAPIETARTYCRIVQLWVISVYREQELKLSEQRFRDVAESAGDWIWEMDHELRFTYGSPRFYEIFRITPEELIGKARKEIASSQMDDSIWREHEAQLEARLPFRDFAYSTKIGDGKTRHLKISGKPIYDSQGIFKGYRGTGYDVTEHIETREALERSQTLLSDAIDTIPEGFSLYDEQDRLVVFNSRFLTLLFPNSNIEINTGMSFEAIIRQAAENGIVPEAQGRIEEWVKERLARRRERSEPLIQQRGDNRWILISEHKTHDGGTVALYSDITELKQRENELSNKSKELERLSSQLAKYLSPQIYESIFTGRNEVKVASQRKKLTVFFSDISGFTEITDQLESEELTQMLNLYLTEMSRIALDHGATIDKYVGDAIVIFFGDPESQGIKQDAIACLKMAIEMRKRLQILNHSWKNSGIERPLKCRIGIHTGFCTVGNFGSEDRMDYTIIGSGVNLASRLESTAETDQILISHETFALVRDEIDCRELGQISVKGISNPVTTYEAIDSYEKSGNISKLITANHPNLFINLDLETMSHEEKSEALDVLRQVLDQVSNSLQKK